LDRDKRQTGGCQASDLSDESWGSGRNGRLKLSESAVRSFTVTVPAGLSVRFWNAQPAQCSTLTCTRTLPSWKTAVGGFWEIGYTLTGTPERQAFSSVQVNGQECLGDAPPPTKPPVTKAPVTKPPVTNKPVTNKPVTNKPVTKNPNACDTKYNYADALHKSLLFYEAQRSGKLPASNRIPWRSDSALKDGSDVGKDLTGGYYDAGDFVKFGLPMASTVTMLAWGMILFKDGYKQAGEYENGLAAIKWGTDYFIKCHTGPNEFYGQVGNGDIDHASWNRDVDIDQGPGRRPSYVLNQNKPGSEVAGETAAALAAASIVFKKTKPGYSAKLLRRARQLWGFGNRYRGKYSDSIPDAAKFYKSWSGYEDELAWGAAWLAKATGPKASKNYLKKAEQLALKMQYPSELSWDNKWRGVQILLADLTKKAKYKNDVQGFCNNLVNNQQRTPQGMVFIQKWGSNRHASNVAFACLAASRMIDGLDDYSAFTKEQIGLVLGDAGRSYVVGFGNNPPTRPHHSGASCPNRPASCSWPELNTPNSNPHVLYGALVGGPSADGYYADVRTDYVKNEVATDYNAGYQSALAGLLTLAAEGKCTPVTTKSPVITNKPVTNKPITKAPVTKKPVTKGPVTKKPGACTTKYDYSEVLHKSLLFYEANRSGKLPASNRIPWRSDSALKDGSDVGKDLTGGYYDAGDFVKFGLPMASTVTMLAWGMILFKDGYKQAGEYENGLAAIKWGTDYFIKCHTGPNEFYGQVGNGDIDHASWNRDVDIDQGPGRRPSYVLNQNKPGSEVAGETAAALAAASIVFKTKNPTYSATLLTHAKQLFNFGDRYRGKYSDSIPDAAKFYNSWSGYNDELAWGAAWLAKATGDQSYTSKAAQFASQMGNPNELSWDNKARGVQILLAELTKQAQYSNAVRVFCDHLVNNQQRTPQGMVFIQPWGSNRHASNVAFACLAASRSIDGFPDYSGFSKQQIGLVLGDAGRSYVVGFGKDPPQRPHHSGASCPNRPAGCSWNELNTANPNPHVLNGALVGGPDASGNYADVRTDYIKNEVATDYNAGFQSAVAGLLTLAGEGTCP